MPCRWNSSAGYCCTWSQSWHRRGQRGNFRPKSTGTLLNIKVKLEAEMATYRRLLEDGEEFSLDDALDSSNSN